MGGTASTPAVVPRRAWVEQVMGLPVSIHLRGPSVRTTGIDECVQATFDELRAIDSLFSTYRADSEVSRINRGVLARADAHPLVQEIDALCELARDRTDGCFDAMLPDPHGGTWWDPSGVVKGWAAQRAATRLARIAGHDVSVNAGGDIALIPDRGDAVAWRIGIEDPDDRGRLLAVVPVVEGGVATSGTAARGSHVRDPRTGRTADLLRSVTVVGPSLLWADIYATAALVKGRAAFGWLVSLAGYEALVVGPDGVRQTPGFPASRSGRQMLTDQMFTGDMSG
jgi:thiamine biosynthesis lipoprotein